MAVLGGIVITDDEVGAIGGEVVFVLAAEFVGFASDVVLLIQESVMLAFKAVESERDMKSGTVPLVLERCWCSIRRRP